jgi:cytochrome b involved in lipid metabolism
MIKQLLVVSTIIGSALLLGGCGATAQPAPTPNTGTVQNSTTSPPSAAATATIISAAELAKHNNAQDCWLAIEGKVYNVTNFIPGHPGGDSIVRGCGQDATAMFNQRPDGSSHSSRARDLLPSMIVGTYQP